MGLFSKSTSSSSASATPPPDNAPKTGWKARSQAWGGVALEKGVKASDWAGGYINSMAEKAGAEHFYPTTGDFPQEMDKAARILRAFTVDGVETEAEEKDKNGKVVKKVKVFRKIPSEIIRDARGLVIFTSYRFGIAPLGGAGGGGVIVAKLPDNSWSPPSCISPNSFTVGLMLGLDIFDAVVVIRTDEAMKAFASHTATLGTDIGVAAGPYGAGAAVEAGMSKVPVFTYVKSRGLYAGIQLVGQVFVDRFDENATMYHWPGVKAGDILSGKVRMPHEAKALQAALTDASSGRAQSLKGSGLDVIMYPDVPDTLELESGEVLRLPPTPTMELEQERRRGRSSDELSDEEEEKEKEMEGGPSAELYQRKESEGLPPPPRRNVVGPATTTAGARAVPPPLPGRGEGWVPPPPPRRNPPPSSSSPVPLHVPSSATASSTTLVPSGDHLGPPPPQSEPATLSTGFESEPTLSSTFENVSLNAPAPSPPHEVPNAAALDPPPFSHVQAEGSDTTSSASAPAPMIADDPVPSYDNVMEEHAQTDERPPPPIVAGDRKEQLAV